MSSADPIHRILYVDDDADVGVSFSRAVRRLSPIPFWRSSNRAITC